MSASLDREDRVRQFRARLMEVMSENGVSQSALARRAGIDRSTLSQLLAPDNDRLPRADTVAALALALQVSLDWLLGLSQQKQLGADILEQSLLIEAGGPEEAERRLAHWHDEAVGYKIRYVPATLPDLLKTDAVIEYEFRPFTAVRPDSARRRAAGQLAYTRLPETDMEVCTTMQVMRDFAQGHGLWRDLPGAARAEQLDLMARLSDELYPTFRWFLFDGLERYSVPVTIFGNQRAAVYMGQMFFVFTTTDHIRVLTRHFDDLIRAAVVQPPDVPDLLRRLRDEAAAA
ncbi:MAG: helix-turn-helix transcriptional regulator [Alphaproteobacteria bacterium]